MLKLIKIFFVTIVLSTSAFAASDGDLELSKKDKDTLEDVARDDIWMGQALKAYEPRQQNEEDQSISYLLA